MDDVAALSVFEHAAADGGRVLLEAARVYLVHGWEDTLASGAQLIYHDSLVRLYGRSNRINVIMVITARSWLLLSFELVHHRESLASRVKTYRHFSGVHLPVNTSN